jgi:hypothetical protein
VTVTGDLLNSAGGNCLVTGYAWFPPTDPLLGSDCGPAVEITASGHPGTGVLAEADSPGCATTPYLATPGYPIEASGFTWTAPPGDYQATLVWPDEGQSVPVAFTVAG